jgi:small conductance mechanosensitive channel
VHDWFAAATESPSAPPIVIDPPDSVDEATSLLLETLGNLWTAFVANLPLIVLVAFVLLALSISGVPVGAALAGLGLAGLAIAFAVQSILENFVAGILLIIRKPIVHGEQVIIGDWEGTVEDIDLRVTRLIDYDGELVIIPNGEVFKSTLINLTRRGTRRSRVIVGIDYRNDHDAAGPLLEAAAASVPAVLPAPAPQARCVELGDSSVDFEVRYWTAPDIATVVDARDAVLRAVKSALEEAGMTIPWPIRTLARDAVGERLGASRLET